MTISAMTIKERIRPEAGEPRAGGRRPAACGSTDDTNPADELDLLEPDFDDLDSDEHGEWVDSAPFRAHVHQLIEEHGLAWRTIAVLAEVPAPALASLMRGRGGPAAGRSEHHGPRYGRPVPRVHPLIAERLFHLTSESIVAAADRPAHAGLTRSLLELLERRGWSLAEVVHRTGLPAAEVTAIATGRRAHCSQLTEATIKAAAQALWAMSPPVRAGRHRSPRDQMLVAA